MNDRQLERMIEEIRCRFYRRLSLDAMDLDGGKGSGNWGHRGIKGHKGGSLPGGGNHNRQTDKNGKYTSFSKRSKELRTLHESSAEEIKEAGMGATVKDKNGVKWVRKSLFGTLQNKKGETISPEELAASGPVRIYLPESENKNKILSPEEVEAKKEHKKAMKKAAQEGKKKLKEQQAKEKKANADRLKKKEEWDSYTGDDPKRKAMRYEDPETVDDALRDQTTKIWNKLKDRTKEALRGYTDSTFKDINEQLRNGKNNGMTRDISLITTAIYKSTLPAMWLTRGIGKNGTESYLGLPKGSLDKILGGKVSPDTLVGKSCKDNGFMSCGATEGKGFVDDEDAPVFHIYCPEGTSGIYAEPFSEYATGSSGLWDGKSKANSISPEQEVILQRGTTTKITKAWIEDGRLHVECEVTGQET